MCKKIYCMILNSIFIEVSSLVSCAHVIQTAKKCQSYIKFAMIGWKEEEEDRK